MPKTNCCINCSAELNGKPICVASLIGCECHENSEAVCPHGAEEGQCPVLNCGNAQPPAKNNLVYFGFDDILSAWISQGRDMEHIVGVQNFLSGIGGRMFEEKIKEAEAKVREDLMIRWMFDVDKKIVQTRREEADKFKKILNSGEKKIDEILNSVDKRICFFCLGDSTIDKFAPNETKSGWIHKKCLYELRSQENGGEKHKHAYSTLRGVCECGKVEWEDSPAPKNEGENVNNYFGFEEIMNEWIKQGRPEEAIWGVKNFLSGIGGVKIRAMIDGSKPQPDKEWQERFDEQMKPWVAPFDEAMRFPLFIKEIKSFISQEIAEAEARGYENGLIEAKRAIEDYEQARLSAFEEMERFVREMETPGLFKNEWLISKPDLLSFLKSKGRRIVRLNKDENT